MASDLAGPGSSPRGSGGATDRRMPGLEHLSQRHSMATSGWRRSRVIAAATLGLCMVVLAVHHTPLLFSSGQRRRDRQPRVLSL